MRPLRKLTHSKICKKCNREKMGDKERKRSNGESYVSFYCIPCTRTGTDRYRELNPEQKLLSSAKARAKRFSLPCDLVTEDIKIPDLCPIFGIPLAFDPSRRTDNTPSVDRVIPNLGYVRGNIVVISWRANRLKNDATLTELQALANFYSKV